MALLERLQILIDADGKGAVREFQKVGATADRELSRVDERTQKMSAGLTTFGATAVTASAVAAVGLGKLAMTASDYGEAISASSVIFEKEAVPALEAYGEAAAEASGLSKTAAVDGANQFGTFGKAAGLAGDDLVEFSTDLTSLAGDLASFKNTTPDEAIAALGSALRGESEPLRKYGVLLDDATLKAEAMALGIYNGNGPLTTQQKILAANEAIFKQTSDAQGDFARTSDSLANRQRALAAEFENVKVKIGEGLIPLFEKFAGVASSALDGFGALPDSAQSAIGTIAGLGVVAGGAVGAISLISGQAIKARDSLTLVGTDGTRSLNKVGKAATALGGVLATIAVTDIVFNFINDGTGVAGDTKKAIDEITIAREKLSQQGAINAFGDLVGAEQNTLRFQNLWQELGAEIEIVGTGVKADIEQVQRAFDTLDPKNQQLVLDAMKAATAELDPNSDQYKTNTEFINDNQKALDRHAKASKVDAGAIGEGSAATADATLKIKDYGTALDFVKAAQDITAAGASGFAEAIKASSGGLNENLDAAQGVGSAFKDLGAIVGQLPAQYDLGAAAAGKYTDEQNKALDTFQAAGSAVQTQLETLIATGASYEQITLAAAGYEAQLRKQLESVGITGAAQEEYIRLLGLTPEQVSTAIQLSGMEQARAQLAFLQGDLDSLPEEVTSSIYAKVAQNDWVGALEVYKQFKDKQVKVTISAGLTPQAEAALNSVGGTAAFGAGGAGSKYYRRASGGTIPGTGNGDTVPAMLTPGEYVIQKSAAQAIGLPMLERLNKGDKSVIADMGAQVQRFANGGMVEASPVAPQVYRPTMTYADAGGSGATTAPSPQSGQMFGDVYITTTTPEELPAEMSRSALRLKALLG
jgi:hypothetical protein